MQTNFTPQQLLDPSIAEAESILRKCVHCGFCTATCPTFVETGDELDSPRGRIYLIKTMLEEDRPADARTTYHLDRCLTCTSCMTTCPSSVDYLHLVDIGREHVEKTFNRAPLDRLLRWMLAKIVPRPGLFAALAKISALVKPVAGVLPKKLRPFVTQAPAHFPKPQALSAAGVHSPQETPVKMRVGLLRGCVQRAVAPEINEATVRLLNRLGVEVVSLSEVQCCGAAEHHLGQDVKSRVKANISAWLGEKEARGLDAIVVNTSGCGTILKDYGHMLQHDTEWADRAAEVSALSKDISEVLSQIEMPETVISDLPAVTYHAACSLQHGQKITKEPKALLVAAGFEVRTPADSHLCCGSAGTYNILQAEMAENLKARKVGSIEATTPDVVAAGNVGCIMQLRSGMNSTPVIHTVQLLDWVTGGPKPQGLS